MSWQFKLGIFKEVKSQVNKLLLGHRSRPWLKTLVLLADVGDPVQGPQTGHETVLSAAVDHEPGQFCQTASDRFLRDGELSAPIMRSNKWVHLGGRAEEGALVDPLRLDEFELPGDVRSDADEQDAAIGPVIL